MSNKRLEHLLEKKKLLEARIQKLKAQESAKKRKEETRRKILLGALVIHLMSKGYWSEEEVYKQLDKFLDKPIDRKLFDLPEKLEVEKTERVIKLETEKISQSEKGD